MRRLSKEVKCLLVEAIERAQEAGDLPPFEAPEPQVTKPRNEGHGDYATPVAMALARDARMKPDQIAEILIRHLPENEAIGVVERAGGFINFTLADDFLLRQVESILSEDPLLAQMDDFAGKLAQVECVSANPTGPITVGRVRGGIIGDTLARLLRAMGYTVELEYYFNNAGRQMRKLGESLKARYLERLGLPAVFPEEGYQGDYLYDIADALIAERGDSLREADYVAFKDYAEAAIFGMIKAALARVGIVFDHFFNENWVYENGAVWRLVDRLRELGLVYEAMLPEQDEDSDARPDTGDIEDAVTADGKPATWIRMRQLRDVKKDAAIIKSSGEPTYRLPDTAYHLDKLDRGFNPAINILGADHIEEAKDVAAMVAAVGYDASRIHVLLHQFVTLTESGETRRMSTRKGDFVTLDELVDDVGADAVRYFILARSPASHMDFDLDLARKHSNENPVYYIQNAHVRCASIARVAEERGVAWDDGDVMLLKGDSELRLIRKMIELPEVIEMAAAELEPHRIAFWAQDLARIFHPVYEEVRALHSTVDDETAKARLKLYAAARRVFARTLDLMGMSAPDSM